MRPSRDAQADHHSHSHTPIYDALYSEYRRSFRTLPGDRSGEEDLGFRAFGAGTSRSQGPGQGGHGGHTGHSGFWHSNGRQHTGNLFPAALPPAPRRGM
ncbi:hypothetical protein [Streptomyces sp. ISL-98]|uniref:hypothetical protein n=1 Tax=Streptomyces sp. ISL-98 TaxID=2819192 RepID=UPI0020353A5C|nr:hypothetical protein [Streptomyces sp. ISL-98]